MRLFLTLALIAVLGLACFMGCKTPQAPVAKDATTVVLPAPAVAPAPAPALAPVEGPPVVVGPVVTLPVQAPVVAPPVPVVVDLKPAK